LRLLCEHTQHYALALSVLFNNHVDIMISKIAERSPTTHTHRVKSKNKYAASTGLHMDCNSKDNIIMMHQLEKKVNLLCFFSTFCIKKTHNRENSAISGMKFCLLCTCFRYSYTHVYTQFCNPLLIDMFLTRHKNWIFVFNIF
jgi:hypothetical protein